MGLALWAISRLLAPAREDGAVHEDARDRAAADQLVRV